MTESPKRIVVGLSGGVDSAVAALRLVRAGHEVIGLFMKNWEDDDTLTQCSAEDDIAAAVAVAEHLGIPIRRVNFAAHYRREVFEHALQELRAGRTPNPDILCNRHVKFDRFLRHAREQFEADAVATGHYARTGRAGDGEPALLRGIDPSKDQSYFLAGVPRQALDAVRFPLGDSTKETVRAEARSAALPNFDRPDSTGICFIGERDFTQFMQRYIDPHPGPILTEDGREIGRHCGLAFYTLGQRRGLGIGGDRNRDSSAPWYVAGKDARRNALFVVQGHDHPWLQSAAVSTEPFHWLAPVPAEGARLHAQVRYRQEPQAGQLSHAEGGRVVFRFDEPQRAATPGQHLVLYDREQCLGGGVIDTAHPADRSAPPALQTQSTEVV
ncbi:tRNA 2-thiouridine(34) synthase MnmA [Halorhodospira halophila]|uniref:tRNA-specific 2-thiouridylase MnmA n=1 Tax=Halorhodospira halophila (strain DSM 244 / SL1) TaxID=349124 RepID=MNMA_HALHL|nr:tRNA 2-thiouridine(34) synthase MnmA [Halorhodospira halophila]A1WWV9.1 RecName: Full=tRNA-specific 2-thiouridylase MnmA [Halorhodospira halophila SL1]ABM62171.1 tRNA (5-methylaminomethyl-2-thiouridylate)-methyltransferase [Halorhodospira halophila SL1]MBK1729499.1 tRNA 2-thiouridine(34) synthase MnmA [Halorhodospira halophila]